MLKKFARAKFSNTTSSLFTIHTAPSQRAVEYILLFDISL